MQGTRFIPIASGAMLLSRLWISSRPPASATGSAAISPA